MSRALLRYAVAQFARRDVQDVTISERPENAPLVDITDHSVVHISISHSGSWIACATSASPVGLDIECTNKARDLTSMSEWFFTPEEHAWLVGQHASHATEAFYRLWTGKEAVFKAYLEKLAKIREEAKHTGKPAAPPVGEKRKKREEGNEESQ